jgi:hypothetical protein
MSRYMGTDLGWLFFVIALFALVLVGLEIGHRWGRRRFAVDPKGTRAGVGGVEGAIFALLGLLVAFTFAGAGNRFDQRRQLIVEEANDIGTAYLRVALLPDSRQEGMRDLFRKYLGARLEAYRLVPDIPAVFAKLDEVAKIQDKIWKTAVVGCKEDPHPACAMLFLSSLNSMFDIANTRTWATQQHPPPMIFVMLLAIAGVCSLMAGFAMSEGKLRNWAYILLFAVVLSLTVFVILDLEYPRTGFIRVDAYDEALVQVLNGMK